MANETNHENSIIVQDLKKSYDNKKFAVDGISFHVKRGEIYGLLGKNGAGKTTTIRILTTLLTPTSGNATVLGMDVVHKAAQIRKKIGVVLQSESFDFTTVDRNLKIYGMLWEVPPEVLSNRIEEVVELFGLEEIRKKRAFELSGGQKKRLQVAREFLHDMDLLFLDEPTVGMDTIMRRKVLDYVKKKSNAGLTVLFTTHILEEADYLCDRIGIIDEGKIVAEGTKEQLKQKYAKLKTLNIVISELNVDGIREKVTEVFTKTLNISSFKINSHVIEVTGENLDEMMVDIIVKLTEAGLKIERINLQEPTLDDVFMEAVSK